MPVASKQRIVLRMLLRYEIFHTYSLTLVLPNSKSEGERIFFSIRVILLFTPLPSALPPTHSLCIQYLFYRTRGRLTPVAYFSPA